jgi:hypothetical protein
MTTDTNAPDHGVLAAAGLSRTPFTRAEALRAGVTSHELRLLIDEGALRLSVRGVYVPAPLPDSLEGRVQSLVKVAAAHVIIVDRTAAWLWGVSAFTLAEESGFVPIDAYSLRGRNRVRRPGVRGGARDLRPSDWVETGGVRVTSPVRTALDLACSLGRLDAVAAVDALMRAQGLTRADLYAQLPRFRGRRGVIQAREVVSLVDPRSESQGESFTRVVIIDEGFPVPSLQVWVHDEQGRPLFRLDHAYERLKIAVEYDGEQHHTFPEDQERDARRRAWLRAHGWIVIVVTKSELAVHSRIRWVEELRRARQQRLDEKRPAKAQPRRRAGEIPRQRVGRE